MYVMLQLPVSCINRATEMAMKLEEAVSKRRKSRLAQNSSLESDETGDKTALKEFKEMFSNLNLAFSEDMDPAKSFERIKHARSLALELRNR